jgi:hypothetical protein
MTNLLELLAELRAIAPLAADLAGRKMAIQFAAATNNDDPLELRRVATTTADKAGLTQHDYAMRSLPCPYWDPPLPSPGMALSLQDFDGNPHDQTYSGVMVNATNPPFEKEDIINDDWRRVPGDQTLQVDRGVVWEIANTWSVTIGENETHTVAGDVEHTIEGNEAHTVTGTITHEGTGNVSMVSAEAMTIEGGAGKIEITAGGNINITTTTGRLTLNGVEVAVIGAIDQAGHALVSSGQ